MRSDAEPAATGCLPLRRCRRWSCDHCAPIRSGDEYRKLLTNLLHYGGRVVVIAVTAPGQKVLPWDTGHCSGLGQHVHSGILGCRVDRSAAWGWNRTASARYGRLMKAAQLYADRLVRRQLGPGVKLPRRVAVAWSEQLRGVWHVHEALPAETEIERIWSRQVVRFIEVATKRDSRRPVAEQRTLLDVERYLGEPTRGFYGWGFVDRNPLARMGQQGHGGSPVAAAAYLAKNVARYLGANVETAAAGAQLPGRSLRSYVARRLTTETGCTIRNLRRCRYLYVLIRDSLPLPEWSPDELEVVARLLGLSPELGRAP